MKKAMKVLGILLCAVLLVVGSVAATLAYLTATTHKITNTFSVGDVKITLTEAKVNESGVPVSPAERLDGTDADQQNTYHFMPHIASYTKDPTVTVVEGSDDCYVRVMVTVTAETNLAEAGTVKSGEDENVQRGFTYADFERHITLNEGWAVQNKNVTIDGTKSTVTYEFRYNEIVSAGEDIPALFSAINGVETPADSGEYLYDGLYGIHDLTVEAHAIQADGFDGGAAEAWETFDVAGAATATK